MAENKPNTELAITNNNNSNPNPICFLISKFQSFFNLPPPSPNKSDSVPVSKLKTNEPKETEKPQQVTIRFPRGQADMPTLRVEGDEQCGDKNTNPIVLWQVYAIGGFFVVRWVLARLNERRNKKPPSDEEPSPNDE